MLRRLFLGKPRNDENESKCEVFDEEKRPSVSHDKISSTKISEEKIQAKHDISDSDSDSESSETEESETDSINKSSKNDSFEECSGDLLEWKGFEMMKDERLHEGTKGVKKDHTGIIKDKVSCGEGEETEQRRENPFAHVFENQETKIDNSKSNGKNNNNSNNNENNNNSNNNENNNNSNNNENNNNSNNSSYNSRSNTSQSNNSSSNNNKDNISSNNDNNNSNIINNTNTTNSNVSNNNNNSLKIENNEEAHQTDDNNSERLSNNKTSTSSIRKTNSVTKQTKNTNNNITNTNHQQAQDNSKEETNKKQIQFDGNQSKPSLKSPKPVPTNHMPRTPKTNGISRHSSFRGNQRTPSIKKQTSGKMENRSVNGPKVLKDQSSTPGHKSTPLGTKGQQGIGKGKTGLSKGHQRIGNASNFSVQDLEKILGVDVSELREVVKKFKSEPIGTTVDSQGQTGEEKGDLGSTREIKNDDKIKECKSEIMDIKDEISSDSGVSEPDAHSRDGQPRYIPLKAIIKRKKYLAGQIRKLEERMAVMKDHKKDIEFVHDLFDLHSDGLAKVERNNGGIPCVENLKSILENQMHEMDDEDLKAKLKALEDLGIPHFSEINARIEKLRERIRHTVDDERKCRSKGVQKLRFEIGKVQGMCEAVLDCVYAE